jgi:hypothetical protein
MKKPLKFVIIAFSGLLFLLFLTEPAAVPQVVLIVPFVIIFAIIMTLLAMLLGWRQRAVGMKQLQIGALGATLPTLLLVLQSVGQLTLRDSLTIFVLFVVTYFYLYRRKLQAR